ncbi:MAG: Glycerate 2-kinase [Promethearchaeota archaeon]|nr:MAG: Glycerate 2-kinase [Candidatus Lokiarchaeota archaeon]
MVENYAININFDLFFRIIIMIFKNISNILFDSLPEFIRTFREIGLECLQKAVDAVKPQRLIYESVKVNDQSLFIQEDIFHLDDFDHIYVIGGGKATAEMAFTLELILQESGYNISQGFINIPEGLKVNGQKNDSKIQLNFASHPVPNEIGVYGVKKMVEIIETSKSTDLIICLISGGGSALLPYPKASITLEDLQIVNSLLLESGATIQEFNAIRKHLSRIKGGNLAKIVYETSKATLLTLIISDVIGDPLDVIASGPTVPDTTRFHDAIEIFKNYNLWESIPESVKLKLNEGKANKSLENPDKDNPCFSKVHNYLIGSIKNAEKKVDLYLKSKGFHTQYYSDEITGEARDYGRELYSDIREHVIEMKKKNIGKLALIGSGELTVTIQGKGIGGRNQEMLLSFLETISRNPYDFTFLIIGANLDGIEGNSSAMGALVDNFVLAKMRKLNIDPDEYLRNNNSNSFFKQIGTELYTGYTGCNVNDLLIILLEIEVLL